MNKRVLLFFRQATGLLVAIACMLVTFHSVCVPVSAATTNYGLTLKNGSVMLNGKPYYAMGVNLYDAFLVYLRGNTKDQAGVEGEFRQLKESGIPLVRISMCGYSGKEYGEYLDYPEYYFSCLDKVIAYAEKYKIGIVFDLCWAVDAIPDYYWGYRSDIGNANSEVVKAAKSYVKDIVTRYKNSPAVWAWEIGNEYNLDADLDGVLKREESKALSSDDIHVFYEELARTIRSVDTYRLITGGDSEPRSAAYHLYHNNTWTVDSYSEMAQMMKKLSPEPMNMMSVHVYQDADNSEQGAGSITSDQIEDFDRQVGWYVQAAKEANQALFVGEFGIMERTCKDISVAKEILKRQYNAFMKHGVQLSCIWVYGKDDGDPMNISPTNNLAYQYNVIVSGNERYRSEGKQDATAYWKSAKPLIYKENTATTSISTSSTTQTKPESRITSVTSKQTSSIEQSDVESFASQEVSAVTESDEVSVSSKSDHSANAPESQNGTWWVWLLVIIAILILAAGIVCFLIYKRRVTADNTNKEKKE